MPSSISTHNVPLLKLLIPFMVGICVNEFGINENLTVLVFFIAWLGYGATLLARSPLAKERSDGLFRLATGLLFFALGCFAHTLSNPPTQPLSPQQHPYVAAQLLEDGEHRESSVRCFVELLCALTNDSTTTPLPHSKAVLYLEKDSLSQTLKRNQVILIKNSLTPIENTPNPDVFDYATYMRRKGYHLAGFVAREGWRLSHLSPTPQPHEWAYRGRMWALNQLQKSRLKGERLAVMEALLLGYTDHLTTEQRSQFSAAGLSHILAVSGLHTGVILLLITILLSPLVLLRLRPLQLILALGVVWLYAIVTGLSPSMVRAAIMATTLLGATLLRRPNSSLNALALAAFVLLLMDTNNLFGVSFQLSFAATCSILLFYPHIRGALSPRSLPLQYVWSTLSVTLAAQVGVLPIAIYYFHELPLLFCITNLAVIPLLPLVMGGGLLLLLAPSLGWVNELLSFLLHELLALTQWVGDCSWGSVKEIVLPRLMLLLYFGVAGAIYGYLQRRKGGFLVVAEVLVLVAIGVQWVRPAPTPLRRGLVLYHQRKGSTLQLVEEGKSYILVLDSASQMEEIERLTYPFRLKNRLAPSRYLADGDSTAHIRVKLPYVHYFDTRLFIANQPCWKGRTSATKLAVDYCIVGDGFRGRLSDLQALLTFKGVIIAPNLNYFSAHYLVLDCRMGGIPCHYIREQGAWVFAPQR